MSARVLVHPKVATTPALGEILAHFMSELGYDMTKIAIYQPYSTRKSSVYEMIREVAVLKDHAVFRRMDGTPFKIYPAKAPEAA